MTRNSDDRTSAHRKLSELYSSLDRHDRHFAARHTPESIQIRTKLVCEIQALKRIIGADDTGAVE
jgi:hypothetical protein